MLTGEIGQGWRIKFKSYRWRQHILLHLWTKGHRRRFILVCLQPCWISSLSQSQGRHPWWHTLSHTHTLPLLFRHPFELVIACAYGNAGVCLKLFHFLCNLLIIEPTWGLQTLFAQQSLSMMSLPNLRIPWHAHTDRILCSKLGIILPFSKSTLFQLVNFQLSCNVLNHYGVNI